VGFRVRVEVGVRMVRRSIPFFRRASRSGRSWTGGGRLAGGRFFGVSSTSTGAVSDDDDNPSWCDLPDRLVSVVIVVVLVLLLVLAMLRSPPLPPSGTLPLGSSSHTSNCSTSTSSRRRTTLREDCSSSFLQLGRVSSVDGGVDADLSCSFAVRAQLSSVASDFSSSTVPAGHSDL